MPKLRTLSGKEACKILTNHGFVEVRQRGGHVVMQKKDSSGTVTVLVPAHKALRIGTLSSIVRQSQISRSEFEV